MQPTHATSDMGWAGARVGRARLEGAYAWRSLRARGAVLAFGSDAPIEPVAPLRGLFAAVHRTDLSGRPRGGWLPQERLDPATALEAFTVGSAYAVHREDELGRLRVGALADLTVLDRDPTRPGADLRGARVLRTIVGGREVFVAPRS
jgi:predicted amidohydrolase YtcJ